MSRKTMSKVRLFGPMALTAMIAMSLTSYDVAAAETEGSSVAPATGQTEATPAPAAGTETAAIPKTETATTTVATTPDSSTPNTADAVETAPVTTPAPTANTAATRSTTPVVTTSSSTTAPATTLPTAISDSNTVTPSATTPSTVATPQAEDSNKIINVDKVWTKDYKGQGMVVAVIDSGLDVNHEVLRLSDISTAKYKTEADIEAAKAAAGINYGQWYNEKVIFGYNYTDVNNELKETKESSHGMHVSGISVGNPEHVHSSGMKITGVAPEAQLMFMRVFSDDRNPGTTDTLLYARAIEDAVKLGADAINLSLGSANGSLNDIEDHLGRAIAAARKAGVAVVIAAGNDTVFGNGKELPYVTNPDYGVVGNPSTARDSISVAAYNNTHLTHVVGNIKGMEGNSDLNNGKFTFTKASNSKVDFPSDKEYDYVYVNLGKAEDFNGLDLTGKIALIKRGEITFADKIANAKNAKAAGVVVFNNVSQSGNFTMNVTDGRLANTPTAFINKEFGDELVAQVGTGKYKISFANNYESVANPDAGKMASFSSWGLSVDGELKPDVTAPGGGIFSSVNDNQYDSEDGTSMASPHIAGVVALMKQALVSKYPDLTPEELQVRIKQLLMSTANPHVNTETGAYTSPRSQGAGIADTLKAISSDLYVTGLDDLSSITLGNVKETFTVKVRLHNDSDTEKTVNYIAHLNTENVKDGRFTLTPRELNNVTGTVTVAAHSSVLVPVTLDSSAFTEELTKLMPNGYYLEGFVRFVDPVDGGDLVSIPFVGFKGEFQNLPVLEKPVYDFDFNKGDLPFYMDRDEDATTDALKFTETGEDYTALITGISEYDHITGNATAESAIIAGTYLNKTTDGEYILHRDENGDPYIVISPNGDHNRDAVLLRGVFLRNYTDLQVKVYKADDTEHNNPIWESQRLNGSKNFWAGRDTNPKSSVLFETAWEGLDKSKNTVPDGKYTYVVTYYPDVPGAKQQELSFNILVDTMRPAVTTAVTSKEERTFKPRPSIPYGQTDIYREMLYYNIAAEEEPTENGETPQNTVRHYIEPDENGVYHLPTHDVNGNELSFSDFWYRVENRAGNSIAANVSEFLQSGNTSGIVAFGLRDTATDEKIDAGLRYIIRDKDGNRVTNAPKDGPSGDMYILPFGDYTVELILHDEDSAYLIDNRIKSFSVTEKNTLQAVYFDATLLEKAPFRVTFDQEPPAGTKIYLVDKKGNRKELPQGRYTPELFENYIVSGEYTIDIVLPDGYVSSEDNFTYTIVSDTRNNKDLTFGADVNYDHDGDGFSTADELKAGTDPFDKDTYPGSVTTPDLYIPNPNLGAFDPSLDHDSDGFTSAEELTEGTDPFDKTSYPIHSEWVTDPYVDGTPAETKEEWVTNTYVDGTPAETKEEWVNDPYVDGTPATTSPGQVTKNPTTTPIVNPGQAVTNPVTSAPIVNPGQVTNNTAKTVPAVTLAQVSHTSATTAPIATSGQVANAPATVAPTAKNTLPATGDKTSNLALLGMALTLTGAAYLARRKRS